MATTAEKSRLVRLQGLPLLLLAILVIGSFFEVICPFAFLCYFQIIFCLKQTTQPVFSLVVFCVCFFLCRPYKKENVFLLTNLLRENNEIYM